MQLGYNEMIGLRRNKMCKSKKRIIVLIFSILFVMAIILAFYIYGISMD